MSEIIEYDSIIECFPILEKAYKKSGKDVPNARIFCVESFISECGDMMEFFREIVTMLDEMKNYLKASGKNMYLCIATAKKTESVRMKEYYKLWRTLNEEYSLENFELGYEQQIQVNGESFYIGCARVDYEHFCRALELLHNHQSKAFIYITSNNSLMSQSGVLNLCEVICNEKIQKIRDDYFDYANMYCAMEKEEVVINVASDGEKISLFLVQKE